jgi:hypothetical protein
MLTARCKSFPIAQKHGKRLRMDGGNKVIGLWRGRENANVSQPAPTGPHIDPAPYFEGYDEGEDAPRRNWRKPLAMLLCGGSALAWVASVGFSRYAALGTRTPNLDDAIGFIATCSAPLALIGVIWMLLLRSSRAEASRFAKTSRALRTESERMETLLAFVTARIDASRRDLAEQGDVLLTLGEDAAKRINIVSDSVRKEVETIAGQTQTLKGTAAAARGDLAILLSHLPKAQVQMRQIAASLIEAGNTAQDKAILLTEQVVALGSHSTSAATLADTSAAALAEQLTKMQETSTALSDMLITAQSKLAEAGSSTTEQLATRVTAIGGEVDRISAIFAAQDEASRVLLARMDDDIGAMENRFTAFEAFGSEKSAQLGGALASLSQQAETVNSALAAGSDTADLIKEKGEGALVALNAVSREIDETLPAAYARLEATALQAMASVNQAVPAMAAMTDASRSTLEHLSGAEAIVERQRSAIASLESGSSAQLATCNEQADQLAALIAKANSEAKSLAEGAALQLVESLTRARNTAQQAAEHARASFADIVPAAAKALGEQSKAALAEALTSGVEAQMAAIAETAERSVATAQKVTDRLMRQLLTISETSAALEARIAEAKEDAEKSDQSNFTRRVALLIESLNSSAIDVTKILSNDVTDTAWAAYLRGDRGVFARRAVKLLDSSDAKEVARHYNEDTDFRDQVNRYIHDYEAMLRTVMSTRDGTPLSVALLSSDTGKLYVALAQAIERLRT